MQISVSGQNMKVGESLTQHVKDSLNARVKKYFEDAVTSSVNFCKEAHLFTVDVHVHDGAGKHQFVKGRGQAQDVYAAFEKAAERVEKQLRRYKRKLKSHSEKMKYAEAHSGFEGVKYVLSNDGQEVAENEDGPLIVAEKLTAIQTFSVSDAVMHMDLSGLPALMFVNVKTGLVNVVYHREDGNISWVESGIASHAELPKGVQAA